MVEGNIVDQDVNEAIQTSIGLALQEECFQLVVPAFYVIVGTHSIIEVILTVRIAPHFQLFRSHPTSFQVPQEIIL
jgi:hypothetical protein